MANVIAAAPPPVWLATIGPATNAAALLAERPDALDRLAGVVMMGGRHDPANPREHNFGLDPVAAAAVCNCGRPVRVGDYLVTSQAQLHRDDLSRVRCTPGIGASLGLMLETYLDRRGRDWTSMYDPATLTLALGEDLLNLDSNAPARQGCGGSGSLRSRERNVAATHRRVDRRRGLRRELLDVIGRNG